MLRLYARIFSPKGGADHGGKVVNEGLGLKGEDLDGVVAFMKGPMMKGARDGFSEEEEARWPAAVDEVVDKGRAEGGGIVMEAWGVVGTK